MAGRKISVEIAGDASSLDRAFGQASKSASSFGSKVGSGLVKIGKAAAVAGAAITAGVGVALVTSAKAALEAEKAQARLDQAFRKANATARERKAAMEEVSRVSNKAALDDEDLADTLARLTTVTGDVSKAQEGMGVAADVARARNMSLEAATKVVEKAYLGNVGALKRIGIEIPKVTAAQDALREAGGKVTAEQMKQAKATDDVATRQQALAKLQEKFAGAAEAYGKTSSGAIDRFKVGVENLQESLGSKLLPVIGKVAGAAADFIDKFSNAEGAGAKFKVVMDTVKGAAEAGWKALSDAVSKINWAEVGAKVGAGMKTVAEKGWQLLRSAVGAINWGEVGETIGNLIVKGLETLTRLVKAVNWGEVGQAIIKGIVGFLKGVDWKAVLGATIRALIAVVKAWASLLWGIASTVGAELLAGLKAGAAAGWEKLAGWLRTIPGTIQNMLGSAGSWLYNAGLSVLQGFWNGLKAKWDAVAGWVGSLKDKIIGLKGPVAADATILTPAGVAIIGGLETGMKTKWATTSAYIASIGKDAVAKFLTGVTESAPMLSAGTTEAVQQAMEAAKAKVESYQDAFRTTFDKLGDMAARAFEGKTQAMLDKITTRFDAAISRWQKYADALTPAEKELAAINDREAQRARDADVIAAQAALSAASTEEEKNAALEQLRQANLANTVAALEKTAAAERTAREKTAAEHIAALEATKARELQNMEERRAQSAAKLDEQLANLRERLAKHPEEHDKIQKQILKLLNAYGVNMKNAGENLGEAFARGIRASIPAAVSAAKALAHAVAQYMPHSPAEKGPLARDDFFKDWGEMIAGNIAGAAGPVGGAAASVAGAAAGGAMAGGGGGGTINVYVSGSYVGDRQIEDVVTAAVERVGRRNGGNAFNGWATS